MWAKYVLLGFLDEHDFQVLKFHKVPIVVTIRAGMFVNNLVDKFFVCGNYQGCCD